MKILVMGMGYYPERTGIGPHTTELCEYLAARGHRVTVATAFPHFPEWNVMKPYRGKLFAHEIINGVSVRRGYVYVPSKQTTRQQILYDSSFCASALLWGLAEREIDLILAVTPPLQLGVTAHVLSRVKRVPFVLVVQDLVPDAAIALGMLKNPRAIRLARTMERFVYSKALTIVVICEGFVHSLRRKGVSGSKILLLPDWVDTTFIRPFPRNNSWREDHGFTEEQYIVLHAGNMGVKQGLDNVIEAANRLRNFDNLVFLIVGDGIEKASLCDKASRLDLENVKLLTLQPKNALPQMLSAADALLVNQRDSVVDICMPTKLLTYMAAGKPIIAAVHSDSETARYIRSAGCGLVVPAERPHLLAEAVLASKDNRQMGTSLARNGRAFAEEHFERRKILRQYAALLGGIVSKRPPRLCEKPVVG